MSTRITARYDILRRSVDVYKELTDWEPDNPDAVPFAVLKHNPDPTFTVVEVLPGQEPPIRWTFSLREAEQLRDALNEALPPAASPPDALPSDERDRYLRIIESLAARA